MEQTEHHLPLIRRVDLKTPDLDRAVAFYTESVGLTVLEKSSGEVNVGPQHGVEPILKLISDPEAGPRPRYTTGLYHLALLYPDQASLAIAVKRLINRNTAIFGYTDHGVSEAVYIADPDGNGIELAWDKPASEWPYIEGKLAMYTDRLDLENLISALDRKGEGSRDNRLQVMIGHIHLKVVSLEMAARFFTRNLDLRITQDTFPGALFLAKGDYHHHIGINTWAGPNAAKPDPSMSGLVGYTVSRPENTAESEPLIDPNGIPVDFA